MADTLGARGASSAPYGQTYEQQTRDQLLLGRYRVMHPGTVGGFGTVLTCWDTRLQRRVAIKRMPLVAQGTGAAGTSTVMEALAEARTSSMLAHPNIVTMFDFEADRHWAYLVMEYVDGLTLSELLARVEGGTLTNDECAHLVRSVGDALAFAHENGVLHLDIKPTNIMIERSGTIKLCDFGMATLASATGFGDARGGTVGYMPPEQIEGGLVDERSDIFSLAVVVWQSLTGESPFAAPSAELSLKKIEKGPKTTLAKIDPGLAGMADEVMRQALSPSAAGRVPTVEAFRDELSFALGDAEAGAESLRALMEQDADEDGAGSLERPYEELPLSYRYPWLPQLVTRTGCSLAALAATWMALGGVELAQASWRLWLALACAGLTAAWTPLGGLLSTLCLCASLFDQSTVTGLALPMALALAFLVWWARQGRRDPLGSLTLLLPSLAQSPLAGLPLAAAVLGPPRAALATAAGWVFAHCLMSSWRLGFDAPAVARSLFDLALRPSSWLVLAGGAAVAGLASLLAHWREAPTAQYLAQLLALGGSVGVRAVAARMENGGTWVAPSWSATAVAVVCCVILCLAVRLNGPIPAPKGAGEFHESA
ncbi:serine/threonine-protein kinase [Olsenella phocaeensis]|uniref:serine/threonine-protein kinase n=1 Tax=Olsenella phocaeensis TaxID=1852385 RepID=UPI003A909E66